MRADFAVPVTGDRNLQMVNDLAQNVTLIEFPQVPMHEKQKMAFDWREVCRFAATRVDGCHIFYLLMWFAAHVLLAQSGAAFCRRAGDPKKRSP